MKDRYRCEMERLCPRPEELERLYAMLEEGAAVRQRKWIGRRAAAVLLAAGLTLTAAAAAVPAVWNVLTDHLGNFAPYAQTVEGAACSSQGVRLQVVSALSDDLEAQVYFSVQDVEQDRLDECLSLNGRLVTGTEKKTEGESAPLSVGDVGTSWFQLLSYDPDTKTALFSATVSYGDTAQPSQNAKLSVTGMSTQEGTGYRGVISCASITGETLKSLPVGAGDRTILSPSDVVGLEYTDAVLPDEKVVLAPEQNPIPIAGTEDMWVSAMGFANDGCFHIRLGFADGISVEDEGFGSRLLCALDMDGAPTDRWFTYRQTLVPGGLDILFPLFKAEDLEQLQNGEVKVYGSYARPGQAIEGFWEVTFQIAHYPSRTLDWTGELAGRQVEKITVSPLSVTMNSNDPGGFHNMTLYALKKDGAMIEAEPDTGRYYNVGTQAEEAVWETFNTWKFEEPVDVEEITALQLAGEIIPVD